MCILQFQYHKHPNILFDVQPYQNADEVPELAMIKCKILAPKNLELPILPMKYNNQLLFPLCGICPKQHFEENEGPISCSHTDEQRAFMTSSTSIEIKYALQAGYKIIQVFHVLEWKEGSSHLFKGYVRDFLKMKVSFLALPLKISSPTKNVFIG